jgi:uncharacterized membrane protein
LAAFHIALESLASGIFAFSRFVVATEDSIVHELTTRSPAACRRGLMVGEVLWACYFLVWDGRRNSILTAWARRGHARFGRERLFQSCAPCGHDQSQVITISDKKQKFLET